MTGFFYHKHFWDFLFSISQGKTYSQVDYFMAWEIYHLYDCVVLFILSIIQEPAVSGDCSRISSDHKRAFFGKHLSCNLLASLCTFLSFLFSLFFFFSYFLPSVSMSMCVFIHASIVRYVYLYLLLLWLCFLLNHVIIYVLSKWQNKWMNIKGIHSPRADSQILTPGLSGIFLFYGAHTWSIIWGILKTLLNSDL